MSRNSEAQLPPTEKDANLRLAAGSPELRDALRELVFAARSRENVMGDPCSLLHAQDLLRRACAKADEVLNKVGRWP